MNYEELFIESNKLPRPLSKKELYSYLEQYKQGNFYAREQVIIHNIRLVLKRVSKRFINTPYDKKDLVVEGIIGLIKSIDTFDTDKNFEFSTYAAVCIDNEILKFLKKQKKFALDQSINTPIRVDKEGNEKKLEDILEDNTQDFILECENKDIYNKVRKIVYSLPDNDREIVLLYFGFIDNHAYTQKEIAEKLKISQEHVSRLLTKNLKKLEIQLRENEIVEDINKLTKNVNFTNQNNVVLKFEDKDTYDEVKKIIYSLTDRDREIVLLYFGFINNHAYTQKEIAEKLKISPQHVSRLLTKNLKKIEIQLRENEISEGISKLTKNVNFTNQIRIILEYGDKDIYNGVKEIIYNLPDKDREIVLLYFGFIDNRTYTQKEIAEKLKISQQYVSMLLTKNLKKIEIQLRENGVETSSFLVKKKKLSNSI